MSYTAKLIEVGGGFEKSSSHTATFEIGSVDEIRSLASYLYKGLTIVPGPAGLGSVMVDRELLHSLAVSRGPMDSQRGGRACIVDTVTCKICHTVMENPYGDPEETHDKECPLYER